MKRKLHYNTATTQMGGGHRDRPRGAKSVLYYIIKESYTTIINETYTTTLQQHRWVADTGIACRAGPSVLQQLPLGTHSENVPFDTQILHPTP